MTLSLVYGNWFFIYLGHSFYIDAYLSHFSIMAPVESGPISLFRSRPLSMRSILFSSLFGFDVVGWIGGLRLLPGDNRFKLFILVDDGVGDVGDLEPILNPDDVIGDVLVAIVVFVMGNEYGENLLVDLEANNGPKWEPGIWDSDCVVLLLNVGDKFG